MVFLQAMRSLLVSTDFHKIKERVVQSEVVTAIANSVHFSLIENLKKVLHDDEQGLAGQEPLDEDIVDQIEDAIHQLKLAKKANQNNP